LAYSSRDTGEFEVYVLSYPALTGKQQVSLSGGRRPEWSAESGERFLCPAPNPEAKAREIYVVLNWFEELEAM
jgi:hypothetical protein